MFQGGQMPEPFEFSFNMEGVDRDALLTEAAAGLNALSRHMGGGAEKGGDSPLAALVKELRGDQAEFAKLPVVEKITDETFTSANLQIGERYKQLTRDHNLYCVDFPVYLHAQRGWGFSKLEVLVSFNPEDTEPTTRPKAIRILPEKKFETQLQGGMRMEVGIDENLDFSAKSGSVVAQAGGAQVSASAGAGANLSTGLNLKMGPFVYDVKRAKIEHSDVNVEKVWWRLNGAEFFQENNFPLVVVLQVPKETKELKVAAVMLASRQFSFLTADFQDTVKELGRRFRNFFEAGAPIEDKQVWDITSRL
jgi:hypothetical protein